MRTRYTNAVVIHAGHSAEEVGALKARNAALFGGHQFLVVGQDGHGIDNEVRFEGCNVFGLLAHYDFGAEAAELVNVVSGVVVGAGQRVAARKEDFRQGRHSGAADSNKVHSFGRFQYVVNQ